VPNVAANAVTRVFDSRTRKPEFDSWRLGLSSILAFFLKFIAGVFTRYRPPSVADETRAALRG
jgi:hypothetical protein